MQPRAALAAALVALAAAPAARAQYDDAAERPRYRTLRQDEDWSALRDPAALPSRDPFDPAKFVALDADRDVWLSFGAQLRARGERWRDYQFGSDAGAPGGDGDDAFVLGRLRAHADLHVGRALRVFVEGKSALVTDVDLPGGSSSAQVDSLALQNGFVELAAPALGAGAGALRATLRAGRQELLFGNQRLVSPSDWSNPRRTFDGVRADLELRGWRAALFWTRPLRVREYDANEHPAGGRFFGLYASGRLASGAVGLDLYALGRTRDGAVWNGTRGHEDRATFGLRSFGGHDASGLDFELEAAGQTGEVGGEDLRAGMASVELGWMPPGLRFLPRLHVGADWASGDHRPGGNVETFDPLFPFGHRFFGEIDAVGRSNLRALSAGLALRPLPRTTLSLTAYRFWLDDADDALYAASGSVLRAPPAAGPRPSRSAGAELDLGLGFQWDPHTQLGVGYGHFFPGDFVRETGPHEAIDFVYAFVQYTL